MIDGIAPLHVWRARPEECFGQAKELRALLMDWEQVRAERLKLASLRTSYVAVHGILHHILADALKCEPERVRLEVSEHGKPRLIAPLASHGRLNFSLSHSGEWMLVGLGWDSPVGMDVQVEDAQADTGTIARQFFSAADGVWLASLPETERQAAFYRLWTLKEAVLKADGRGLEGGLERVEIKFPKRIENSGVLRVASSLGREKFICWSFAASPGAAAALAAPAGYFPAWDGRILDYPTNLTYAKTNPLRRF